MIRIEIANRQRAIPLDRRMLRRAVRAILADEGVAEAEISIAIVDDREIRELHRRYLGEDEPTDVLSFVLEQSESRLDGEVIASADTARRQAARRRRHTARQRRSLCIEQSRRQFSNWMGLGAWFARYRSRYRRAATWAMRASSHFAPSSDPRCMSEMKTSVVPSALPKSDATHKNGTRRMKPPLPFTRQRPSRRQASSLDRRFVIALTSA